MTKLAIMSDLHLDTNQFGPLETQTLLNILKKLDMDPKTIEALDGQLVDLGDKQLVHVAGWYDYSFNTQKTIDEHAKNKTFYWFDRKLNSPFSDQELTQQSLEKNVTDKSKTSLNFKASISKN